MVFLIMLIILVFIGSIYRSVTDRRKETHPPLIFEEEVLIVQQVIDEETDHKP